MLRSQPTAVVGSELRQSDSEIIYVTKYYASNWNKETLCLREYTELQWYILVQFIGCTCNEYSYSYIKLNVQGIVNVFMYATFLTAYFLAAVLNVTVCKNNGE